MNERKYRLMEQYLRGEYTVNDLIDIIVELEDREDKKSCLNNIRHAYEVKNNVFHTRLDAVKTLNKVREYAEKYNNVPVTHYYDLVCIQSMYVDGQYGWSEETIQRAKVVPEYGGYIIKFPPVEVLV